MCTFFILLQEGKDQEQQPKRVSCARDQKHSNRMKSIKESYRRFAKGKFYLSALSFVSGFRKTHPHTLTAYKLNQ